MPALALTDHGTMFGVIDFYNEPPKPGLNQLSASKLTWRPRSMTAAILSSIRNLPTCCCWPKTRPVTRICLRSPAPSSGRVLYYPRIDHEFLAQHSEGLICTSGCMSAEVPRCCKMATWKAPGRRWTGITKFLAGPLLPGTAAPRYSRTGPINNS